jgi:hypothetical protein
MSIAQKTRSAGNPHDALVLLAADRSEIEGLVRAFERLRKSDDSVEKGKAALRLTHAVALHAAIKRAVLYPAAEAVLEGEDKDLLGKARVEHEGLDRLIDKVGNMAADDAAFDATVAVLGEQICRLMKHEEDALYPRLRHSRLDLQGTGERMASRKIELGTVPLDREGIRQARKVMGGGA